MPLNPIRSLAHDLKTYLNHIVGYCEILIADSQDLKRTGLLPLLNQILKKSRKVRKLISFFFEVESEKELLELATLEDIKNAFYIPLVHIIGDARTLLSSQSHNDEMLTPDLHRLLHVANMMLEQVQTRIVDLRLKNLEDAIEDQDATSTLVDSISTMEKEDGIKGIRARHKGTILVLDDNRVDQQLLKRYLANLGHSVLLAESFTDAQKILSESVVDTILLDLLLGEETGIGVLELLKAHEGTKSIPVLMISAVADTDSIARCLALGAEDFVSKEFDPVVMTARIDACVEKMRLRQEQHIMVQALIQSQDSLNRELQDAASYITKMLPSNIEGDIQCHLNFIPSTQLGGDFANFYWVGDKLVTYMLDVSGHGIKSALSAVGLSQFLGSEAFSEEVLLSPRSVVTELNRLYFQQNHNLLCTLWYGVYDPKTGLLSYTNAGSPPAVLVQNSTTYASTLLELTLSQLPLGVMEKAQYSEHRVDIQKGDKLFVFSDGLFEVSKHNGEIIGYEALKNLLPLCCSDPTVDIDLIVDRVKALTMAEHFEDDVSLIEIAF